jgi:hypothetical protein
MLNQVVHTKTAKLSTVKSICMRLTATMKCLFLFNILHCPCILSLFIKLQLNTRNWVTYTLLFDIISDIFRLVPIHHQGDKCKGIYGYVDSNITEHYICVSFHTECSGVRYGSCLQSFLIFQCQPNTYVNNILMIKIEN